MGVASGHESAGNVELVKMTPFSRGARMILPSSASRRVLMRKSFRSIRGKMGIYATADSAYFPLAPPPLRKGEYCAPPDFVGIGVQKAGTSWWFDLITQHPKVYRRSYAEIAKERQFFSHYAVKPFADHDARQYEKWFPRIDGCVTGEWTPDYLYYSWVSPMLKSSAPQAKLLLLLRNPIDRFVSGAQHLLRLNEGALPDGDVYQDVLSRGLYGHQLQGWLETFPRSQLKVLLYENCCDDTSRELKDTFEFLGLDALTMPGAPHRIVNPSIGSLVAVPSSVRDRLHEFYKTDVALISHLLPDLDLSRWTGFR
jgi:hypothetical protein